MEREGMAEIWEKRGWEFYTRQEKRGKKIVHPCIFGQNTKHNPHVIRYFKITIFIIP